MILKFHCNIIIGNIKSKLVSIYKSKETTEQCFIPHVVPGCTRDIIMIRVDYIVKGRILPAPLLRAQPPHL